ncbi:D-isomer specific 2-hydroxyacid dehydrogenase family protein [Streptomyces varsoviensis]|uniref:D-isomer specific 2-hydroxyacid dehydrogenase family protein n=1 Tax=Streptomyces varsoviensis TaxID=67373 RepID=UPI0033CFB46B
MTYSESAPAVARRTPSPASPRPTAAATTGITVYGCEKDEAALFRAMAPRVGVSPTITAAPATEANAALAAGNRCVSVSHKTDIAPSTLLALSRAGVAYISTRSVGRDHIDVEYAARVGISVGNVAYSPDSVADYTVMLMLMAIRHAKSVIRRADVHDYRLSEFRGRELRDLTVGVVGTGRIGTAVMDRLRGFGCRILAHDGRADGRVTGGAGKGAASVTERGAEHVPLDKLLRQSDIVTLHTPLTAGTHHLLNRRRVERMKYGAFVINTGRGALIDTEALMSALESGRLGGAALDVLEGEEGVFYADCRDRPIDSKALLRLQELPNVIVSPHTAYYTDRALRDTVENSLVNCLEFESGNEHA